MRSAIRVISIFSRYLSRVESFYIIATRGLWRGCRIAIGKKRTIEGEKWTTDSTDKPHEVARAIRILSAPSSQRHHAPDRVIRSMKPTAVDTLSVNYSRCHSIIIFLVHHTDTWDTQVSAKGSWSKVLRLSGVRLLSMIMLKALSFACQWLHLLDSEYTSLSEAAKPCAVWKTRAIACCYFVFQ